MVLHMNWGYVSGKNKQKQTKKKKRRKKNNKEKNDCLYDRFSV